MRTLPQSMIDAAAAGAEPTLFLDIYADDGPSDRISTQSDWVASADAAKGADSNVDFNRRPGSVVLSAGNAVSAVYNGPDLLVATMTYQVTRTDMYHFKGGWSWKYIYDGSTWAVNRRDPDTVSTFRASATEIVNEMIVRARFTGTAAMQCHARIVDDQGNQIGRMVSFTPGAAVASHLLTGFAAGLINGRKYSLLIGYIPVPNAAVPGPIRSPAVRTYTYSIELYSYTVVDQAWRIPLGTSHISTGGNVNYQAAGSLTRSFDVGSIPVADGAVSWSDITANGSSLTVSLYYTDSAVVAAEANEANWTIFGVVASGDAITPHRYWRAKINLTANNSGDTSPEVIEFRIEYRVAPITIGTVAELIKWQENGKDRIDLAGYRGLHSLSGMSAKVSADIFSLLVGKHTAVLEPVPIVESLYAKKLRNKQVVSRGGYAGVAETIKLDSFLVEDLRHRGGKHELMLTDELDLSKVMVPATKAGPAWSATADYSINDTVVHGPNQYLALAPSGPANGGAVTPGSDPLVWKQDGTVWATVVYDTTTNGGQPWHAADAMLDLLSNQINVRSEFINRESFLAAKVRFPNRTIERRLTKPRAAGDLLKDLAWLLQSRFIRRGMQFELISDALTTDPPVEYITTNDVKPNPVYRRGWRELTNQGLVVSGYNDGGSTGDEYFSTGEAYANQTSQSDYNTVIMAEKFEDRWNMDPDELQLRLQAAINETADGRRVVDVVAARQLVRLLRLEPGDVVMIDNDDFPAGDPGPFKMVVDGPDVGWLDQSIKMSLLEVV
jgi:hypothetical protein